MKKRKKVTPRWLSVVRKLHTYLGGTTLLTGTLQHFGWTDSAALLFMGWWLALGMLIQFICDMSFKKEPLEDMPVEKTDKIKP